MRNFYLIANSTKPGARQVADEIMDYLHSHGAVCNGNLQYSHIKKNGSGYTDPSKIPEDTQCVITLGGDGTLIQAARDLIHRNLPILGINRGHLGYLTQVANGEKLDPVLDALMEDRFYLEKRMMLDGRILAADGQAAWGGNAGEHGDTAAAHGQASARTGFALNEIVLTRKDVLQALHFQVYVNGQMLNEYTADGIIVATPTGSTAYNLSAGGPIVTPAAKLMVLTPICSHSLNSRSIVLSHRDTVAIRVLDWKRQRQMAVFDGEQMMDIGSGEWLEIREAHNFLTLVKFNNVPFMDTLRQKMKPV